MKPLKRTIVSENSTFEKKTTNFQQLFFSALLIFLLQKQLIAF